MRQSSAGFKRIRTRSIGRLDPRRVGVRREDDPRGSARIRGTRTLQRRDAFTHVDDALYMKDRCWKNPPRDLRPRLYWRTRCWLAPGDEADRYRCLHPARAFERLTYARSIHLGVAPPRIATCACFALFEIVSSLRRAGRALGPMHQRNPRGLRDWNAPSSSIMSSAINKRSYEGFLSDLLDKIQAQFREFEN